MQLRKSLTHIIKVLGIVFAISYPFVVFFALKKQVALRAVVLVLLACASVSFIRNKNIWLFIGVLFLCAGAIVFNQDIFLKLYPVFMNLWVCMVFALSLKGTPLITTFAKKMGYVLDKSQERYTKSVTGAWALFMFFLTICSLITVFLPNEIWVMFNGFVSYILIAIMIGLEFLVRKRFINVCKNK